MISGLSFAGSAGERTEGRVGRMIHRSIPTRSASDDRTIPGASVVPSVIPFAASRARAGVFRVSWPVTALMRRFHKPAILSRLGNQSRNAPSANTKSKSTKPIATLAMVRNPVTLQCRLSLRERGLLSRSVTVHRPPGTGSFFGRFNRCATFDARRPKNVPVPLRPRGTVPFSRRQSLISGDTSSRPRKLGQSP